MMLSVAILTSVMVIMIDSVPRIHSHSAHWLVPLEWAFTVLFTIEYALRPAVVRRPLHYAPSIWGVIELLSVLPSYLSFFCPVRRPCWCSCYGHRACYGIPAQNGRRKSSFSDRDCSD